MNRIVPVRIGPMGFSFKVETNGLIIGTDMRLGDFCDPLLERAWNPLGRFWYIKTAYRYYDRTDKTLYLPLYYLSKFEAYITSMGGSLSSTHVPLSYGKDVSIPLIPNFNPKDDRQDQCIKYLVSTTTILRGLELQTGGGKAQPLTAKVKVPGGWKLMGDLKVGDKVISRDGSATTVTGIFPQGVLKAYRITFEDGRQTTASGDHLWNITRSIDKAPRIETTDSLRDSLTHKEKLFIPLALSEDTNDADLPLDPFYYARCSRDMRISEDYLKGSHLQRKRLLMGFLLLNGCIENDRGLYTAPSEENAADIINLIRSLGGIASYTHEKFSHCVRFQVPSMETYFLGLSSTRTFKDPTHLELVCIEEIESCEMQCISVSHSERLYVTDDYIVTHNTAAAIAAMSAYGKRVMICQTGMSLQWFNAIKEYTLLKDEDIFIVEGAKDFQKLMARIDKSLDPKVIIMSIPTLRSYATGGDSYVKFPKFESILDYLKVGVRIIDEAHLSFHANMSQDIRLNAAINIVLTATFETSNDTIRDIFDNHYPQEIRFGGDQYKRYVNVSMYSYRLPVDRPNQIPANLFKSQMGYNHAKYENWLLKPKNQPILERIVKNVYIPILASVYFNIHTEGEKLLVLASTHDMVEYLADFFRKRYQEYEVGVFVGGSDPEILKKSQIIVSTPFSAGTGRDIALLRSMLVTVSVRSSPLNKQMKGRLRELKSGNTPEYAMCFCVDIPAQVKHAEFREMILKPLALSYSAFALT